MAGMVGGYDIKIKVPEMLNNINNEEDDLVREHMNKWVDFIENQDTCNKMLVEIDDTEYVVTMEPTVIK